MHRTEDLGLKKLAAFGMRYMGKSCYPKRDFFLIFLQSWELVPEFLGEAVGVFWGRQEEALNSGQCIVRFTLASILKFLSTVTSHPVLQGIWVAKVFIM